MNHKARKIAQICLCIALIGMFSCEEIPDTTPEQVDFEIPTSTENICTIEARVALGKSALESEEAIADDAQDIKDIQIPYVCGQVVVDKTSKAYQFLIEELNDQGISFEEKAYCDCNRDLALITSQSADLIGPVGSAKNKAKSIEGPNFISPNFIVEMDFFDIEETEIVDGELIKKYSTTAVPATQGSPFTNFQNTNLGGTHKIGINDSGTDTRDNNNVLSSYSWSPPTILGSCLGGANNPYGVNVPLTSELPTDLTGHGVGVNSVFLNNNLVNPEGGNFTFINAKFTSGETGSGTLGSLLCGIYYLVEEGANPINISAGFDSPQDTFALIDKAVKFAEDRGVVLIAGLGNGIDDGSGTRVGYNVGPRSGMYFEPASSVAKGNFGITVAALDQLGNLAPFSNYSTEGFMTLATKGTEIEVLSPGFIYGAQADSGPNYIVKRSGTSFATPQVTGTIAAMMEVASGVNPQDLRRYISCSGDEFLLPNGLPAKALNHSKSIQEVTSPTICP
ncbi:MAG: S8 family serine peptidase [Bacteroidota bacterium]